MAAKRILIVEDDYNAHEWLQGAVEDLIPDAQCEIVTNAYDAIEHLQQHAYDAALIDNNFPHMDSELFDRGGALDDFPDKNSGVHLIQALRNGTTSINGKPVSFKPENRAIPTLFHSVNISSALEVSANRAGATKTSDKDYLLVIKFIKDYVLGKSKDIAAHRTL